MAVQRCLLEKQLDHIVEAHLALSMDSEHVLLAIASPLKVLHAYPASILDGICVLDQVTDEITACGALFCAPSPATNDRACLNMRLS